MNSNIEFTPVVISVDEQKRIDRKDYIKQCESDQAKHESKLLADLKRKYSHPEHLTYRLFIR